jgi:3-ketosteroid 9alpha-monooxygenase subunit B
MAEASFFKLRVADVVPETAEAHSVVFDVPEDLAQRFRYRPGQFLTLRLPSDLTGTVARCYSLSSSPYDGVRPQITVKRTAEGYGSNWICDNVRPGTVLEVHPPSGRFVPKDLDADLLLLSGGSGITPVMSILRSALSQGRGHVTLVYANRDEDSVIFADALRDLQKHYGDRFTLVHWLESLQGLPDAGRLRSLLTPFADREAFVCGPGPFMDTAGEVLRDLGVPRKRIHVERFVSLHDDPAASAERADVEEAPVDGPPGGSAQVEVRIDGETHRLSWPVGTTLLDLMLDSGVEAPYSCKQGQCSACMCRLQQGEVDLWRNEILEDQDLAEGYTLACQSMPVSETVAVTYDDD